MCTHIYVFVREVQCFIYVLAPRAVRKIHTSIVAARSRSRSACRLEHFCLRSCIIHEHTYKLLLHRCPIIWGATPRKRASEREREREREWAGLKSSRAKSVATPVRTACTRAHEWEGGTGREIVSNPGLSREVNCADGFRCMCARGSRVHITRYFRYRCAYFRYLQFIQPREYSPRKNTIGRLVASMTTAVWMDLFSADYFYCLHEYYDVIDDTSVQINIFDT